MRHVGHLTRIIISLNTFVIQQNAEVIFW